jgi:dUTP pyrophosphatase
MKLLVNSLDYINAPAKIGDAGFDVIAKSDPIIVGSTAYGPYWSRIDYIEYDTGLEIAPEEGYHTLAIPRSSISKTNLFLRNSVGLIDNGYRGTIKFRFGYITHPSDIIMESGTFIFEIPEEKIYKKGDRIGQLVFSKTIAPEKLTVGVLNKTERGSGGFGSTGL